MQGVVILTCAYILIASLEWWRGQHMSRAVSSAIVMPFMMVVMWSYSFGEVLAIIVLSFIASVILCIALGLGLHTKKEHTDGG